MLDVMTIADLVLSAPSRTEAWSRFSGVLAAEGLSRTALHTRLSLDVDNPFADDQAGPSFGHVWEKDYDRRLRRYRGNLRRSDHPDFLHIRPTLLFLKHSRNPLFIDHSAKVRESGETAFKPICRIMVDRLGQQQAVAFPLLDPAGGHTAILSAWGDEARPDFSDYVRSHSTALHRAGLMFFGFLNARWGTDAGPVPEAPVPLSNRERQVLAMLANGSTIQLISDDLGISERSVHEYVQRARWKLGAATRTEAVARAIRYRLID